MDIQKHAEEFNRIRKEYHLDNDEKAEEVAQFLVNNKTTSSKEFSKLFNIPEKDAIIFLSFIGEGIKFRESNQNQ